MNRRQVLALVGTATLPLSGCLGGMPSDAIVRAVRASQPAPNAIASKALPQAEQDIAQRAVEDGLYHACPELPEAVRSFATRFEEADAAYLRYQEDPYALWIRITDIVYASTADPPENDPSCGLL